MSHPLKLVPRGALLTGEIRPADRPLCVGRAPHCEVVLLDPAVSRQHARIQWEGGDLMVEDLASSRGTYLNGVRIERGALQPGDVLRFGSQAEYAVERETQGSILQQAAGRSGAEEEVHHLKLLLDVARTLKTATVLDEVLDLVLRAARRLMSADRACLRLVGEGGQETRLAHPPQARLGGNALLDRAMAERATAVDPGSMDSPPSGESAATPLLVAHRALESTREASFVGRVEVIGGLLIERSLGARGFSREELAVFESLAADAAQAIDSARLYREAREKAKLEHEMSLARTIQARLLRLPPPVPFAGVYAFSQSARSVGGDLYHATLRADGALALAVGDVSGKGMAASLLMSMLQGLLDFLHDLGHPLREMLPLLDRHLRRHNPGNRFLTLAAALLSADGGLEIVNCGHCPVVLLRSRGEVELVQPHGPILGLLPGARWGSERLEMHAGDALVFYSDGILESADPQGVELGVEGIVAALRPLAGQTPEALAEALLQAASAHRQGGEADDDVTVLVAGYRGA